jgi:2-iminobutanoate/2-iminopropanoate deaminase
MAALAASLAKAQTGSPPTRQFGVGGKLSDIVTMTAFITDDRYDRRFLELRKEILGDNFPASAMINIRSLAQPDLLIEIQAVAVVA